jgi:methylated-DNA-protein-cysteine methyltransferase-like protein
MPAFTSPPNPKAFSAQVWDIVRQVPAGRVTTYGQIAAMLPIPPEMTLRDYDTFGARWVGGAMAACPADVPWQRVINAQGKISLRRGADEQKALLLAEGVAFDDHEKVDFTRFGWGGPPQAWLEARGLLAPPSLGQPKKQIRLW